MVWLNHVYMGLKWNTLTLHGWMDPPLLGTLAPGLEDRSGITLEGGGSGLP